MRYQSSECELFYEVEGNPDGGPLLFLHGALGSHEEFQYVKQSFTHRRCLFVDFPAHGASGAMTHAASTKIFAALILELLTQLELSETDVIGYSLGGYVAIEMALQKPSVVRSIVSHAMKFFWTEEAISTAAAGLDWKEISKNERRVQKLESVHVVAGPEAAVSTSRALIEGFRDRQLTIEEVKQLECPILLSIGDSDELVSLEEIHKLFLGLGYDRASLAIHPATRHPIHLLDATNFARSIEQFWKANAITHQQAV